MSGTSIKLPNTRKFHRSEAISFDVPDFFFFFSSPLSDRDKAKVLETVCCFHFGHCKGRNSYQIFRLLGYVLLYGKNLLMFILEILSFVDFTGLDASCTGSPLWGNSQM